MADSANAINLTSSRFRQFCSTNPEHSLHQPISESSFTRLDHVDDNNNDDNDDDNRVLMSQPLNHSEAGRLTDVLKCCCGKSDCAYLEHNNTALGGLERDLETAARLGQALLDRHESYVKESQAEQARLSRYVYELESEKTSLQDANANIVGENRDLLGKLEQLNTDLGCSGERVKELEDLLEDCEQELKRLSGLSRRTGELEDKLDQLERDRAEALQQVEDGKAETRSTIARLRESEKKVKELERELMKIEFEAKLDKEKHQDILARMQRDRELERELGLAEGRLKATTAIQKLQDNGPREKQVVSNFVRDILQDNANLQAGIAELREMLQTSNEEVQTLREQVMLHQPISQDSEDIHTRAQSLGDELCLSQSAPKPVQQQVHVHHHYHTETKKPARTPLRKASRRRVVMSGVVSSSPGSTTPSTPLMRPSRLASSPVVPVNIQSRQKDNRWSIQSSNTASTYLSSMSSSPRSHFDKHNFIFDRMDRGEESSRPTSPDLSDVNSPRPFIKRHRKDDSSLSVFEEEDIDPHEMLSLDHVKTGDHTIDESGALEHETTIVVDSAKTPDLTPKPSMMLQDASTAQEASQISITQRPDPPPPPDDVIDISTRAMQAGCTTETDFDLRPLHRRRKSNDSLVSISGMDIHIAQRPSNSATTPALALLSRSNLNKRYFAPSPMSSQVRKISGSAQPLASVTEFTATAKPGVDTASASVMALNGIAKDQIRPIVTSTNRGLTGLVGGWVSRKWGVAPAKSVADLRSVSDAATRPSSSDKSNADSSPLAHSSSTSQYTASTDTSSPVVTSSKPQPKLDPSLLRDLTTTTTQTTPSMKDFFGGRPPGINQPGAIPGFAAILAAKATPSAIQATNVDIGGLREGLKE